MRTENFKRSVVCILLIFALVSSMISVAPLASPGDLIYDPGGENIEVVQGGTFIIRHTLEWDAPEYGAYTITMVWDCYDNHENENFTFVEASAYFTTGDHAGESILADVMSGSCPAWEYPGSTRYILSVSNPADDKDNRNGQFNVDITLGAYGAGGVPHIPGDHVIPSQFAGIINIENSMDSWNRGPITIKVIGKGVSVWILPSENSGLPGENVTFTVTVRNTGNLGDNDNYDLTVSDNAGWAQMLSENLFEDVPENQSRTSTLTVTIAENATGGTEDRIIVTAISQRNSEVSDNDTCIVHVTIVRGVDISISPDNQSAIPGENLTFIVTVKNTGNAKGDYDLTIDDNAGWGPTLDDDNLAVPIGENRTTTLRVTIHENAMPCTEDKITVTATSQADNSAENSASCIAHATIVRRVEVSIEPENKSGLIGSDVTFEVTVKNTGNVEDNYELEITDDAGWPLTLSGDNLVENRLESVAPRENRILTLVVAMPHNENLVCTEDNITVTATSRADDAVSDNASCIAHVGFAAVEVSISPSFQSQVPGSRLNYAMIVTNRGTIEDTYDLTANDNAGWWPSISPTSLTLGVGASLNATLTLTVPENAIPGNEDNITVTATSRADDAVSDNASCIAHAVSKASVPKAEFSLATLYKVNLDVNLYLESGSKLVVKFYTWGDAFEGETVVWSGSTPDNVILLEDIPHPQGAGVQKVMLVLTDVEGATISTLSTFTVCRLVLAIRYSDLPSRWLLVPTPEERLALAIEFSEIPSYWLLAPSC